MRYRAMVVGVQGYPELPPALQGPKNDAKKFFEWVTTNGGVGPPLGHAKLILATTRPRATALNARPTPEAHQIRVRSARGRGQQQPRRASRRPAVSVSVRPWLRASLNDAALLMANATQCAHTPPRPGPPMGGPSSSRTATSRKCCCFSTAAASVTRRRPSMDQARRSLPVPPAGSRAFLRVRGRSTGSSP